MKTHISIEIDTEDLKRIDLGAKKTRRSRSNYMIKAALEYKEGE